MNFEIATVILKKMLIRGKIHIAMFPFGVPSVSIASASAHAVALQMTYSSFTSFPGILPARNLTRVSLQVRLRKPHLTVWEKMGRIGGVVGMVVHTNAPA